MKQLRYRPAQTDRHYADDVVRLVRAAAAHGYLISPADAEQAWCEYSGTLAAGWIVLDGMDDGDLTRILRAHCEEVEQ